MKKLITVAISVLFILSFAGLSLAAEKKERTTARGYMTGNVVSVDKAANTITIKDKDSEKVFTFTKKTHVIIDAKRRSIDLLVPGEKVDIKYKTKGDKNIAIRINLIPVMGQ